MTLLQAESFEPASVYRLPTLDSAALDTAYGKDGYGARLGDTPGYGFSISIPNPVIIGFNFNIQSATSKKKLVTIGNIVGNDFCFMSYDAGGANLEFEFYNGAVNHTYAYTPSGSVPPDMWHYVELEIYQNTGSAATLDWQLNGGPVADNITNGDCLSVFTTCFFGGNGSEVVENFYFDNFYVCDTSGTVNNTFLGPTRVDDLLPNANGNSTNLSKSDAASYNFELVDDQTPDDDTTYVYSDTEGDKDTYGANDTASSDEVIAGVIGNVIARKEDAGAKFVRPVVRIGGVDYNGDSTALTESYTVARHVWDQSPATASTWTSSEVDGMEIGQEVRDS